jgi:hypothetical protein
VQAQHAHTFFPRAATQSGSSCGCLPGILPPNPLHCVCLSRCSVKHCRMQWQGPHALATACTPPCLSGLMRVMRCHKCKSARGSKAHRAAAGSVVQVACRVVGAVPAASFTQVQARSQSSMRRRMLPPAQCLCRLGSLLYANRRAGFSTALTCPDVSD